MAPRPSLFALAATLSTPWPAWACGGFFCSQVPVGQSGETIAFFVDRDAGQVTMHVQVDYDGPAESFAWVVPVPGEPEVFLSTSALFDLLRNDMRVSYFAQTDNARCSSYYGWTDADADADTDTDADTDADTDTDLDGITVLSQDTVGAYEAVTLSAEDETVLVTWLQRNDFDVPDQLSPRLAPYVALGQNFLALKLRKGTTERTGSLSPLALRYAGTTPAIPLTITAVAAQPDMPISVYLFGPSQGVPLGYHHVVLNPLAIDYWRWGENVDEVLGRAADLAGGRAFATDMRLDPRDWAGSLYREGRYRPDPLRDLDHPADFVGSLERHGFTGTQEVLEVLRVHVPVPESFPYDELTFYNCPECYRAYYDTIPFEAGPAVDALVESEVEPRREAERMFAEARVLTRLRSSLSPEEMTIDPRFGFNPDLDASGMRTVLDVERECSGRVTEPDAATQLLRYPDGTAVRIPSERELRERETTAFALIQETLSPSDVLRIEKMTESGQPEVIFEAHNSTARGATPSEADDVIDLVGGDAPLSDTAADHRRGCGCSAAPRPPGALALLLMTLLARRRRQTSTRALS